MRSVVVVFPASMCAMMPMFRMRSSGVVLGISSDLVGARHWRVGARQWRAPTRSQQKRGATAAPRKAGLAPLSPGGFRGSGERRVGEEGRSRGAPDHLKKKKKKEVEQAGSKVTR